MKRSSLVVLPALAVAAGFPWSTVLADPLPDFSAPDVNTTSNRRGEDVSPRDYRLQISAFYFGHST